VFRRWLDAFVALPDRIKLPLAVFIALLLHAITFFVVAVLYKPRKPTPAAKLEIVLFRSTPKPTPTPTPTPTPALGLTGKPTPTPTPTPEKLAPQDEQLLKQLFAQLPAEKQREYIDVEGLARKKNTSTKALLESWRDSVAGSRKRGTGSDPLPTIDGLENMPFTQMTNREVSLGKPENPPEIAQGDTTPLFKPKPVDPNAQTAPETATAAQPPPTPRPVQTPTPTPVLVAKATPPPNLLSVDKANEDQIPMFLNRRIDPNAPKDMANKQPDPETKPTPQPTATPEPKPTPLATVRPTPSHLPTPTPQDTPPKPPTRPQSVIVAAKLEFKNNQPRPIPNPGYSPQMRRTKVNGVAMPEGEDGVDSVATPLGRYKKAVSSAVGSRWNYYIQQRMSLLQKGKVTVVFNIDSRGKVRSFRVEDNTSNPAHAALIEQCVREAELDPPPPEALRNGIFEYPMSFHLL
jgi:outer membrane biosynthesis protein TonB